MASAEFHQKMLAKAQETNNAAGIAHHTAELAKLGAAPAPSPVAKNGTAATDLQAAHRRIAKSLRSSGDNIGAAEHERAAAGLPAPKASRARTPAAAAATPSPAKKAAPKADPTPAEPSTPHHDPFEHARSQIAKARAAESGGSEPAAAPRKPRVRTPTLHDALSDQHKVERLRINTEAQRARADESVRRAKASAERAESAAAAAKVRHEAAAAAAESAARRREQVSQNQTNRIADRQARNDATQARAAERAHEQHVRHQNEAVRQVGHAVTHMAGNTERIQELVNRHVH